MLWGSEAASAHLTLQFGPITRSVVFSTIAAMKKATGGVISGETKDDRGWVKLQTPSIENKQELVPAPKRVLNGLTLVTGSSKGRGKGKRGGYQLPRVLNTTPIVRATLRFESTAALVRYAVSVGEVLGACGGICTVANSALTCWATSVRVKTIRIYPPVQGSAILAQPAEVTWIGATGTGQKDNVKDRTIPYGVSIGTMLRTTPPKNTFASMWQAASAASVGLFELTIEDACIIELDVIYTLANTLATIDRTIASGVLSNAYYLYLDDTGGSTIAPLGRPRTT